MAIVPGYISRSVAGSYDNEGIAIFALQFTYFLWLKSVKSGSIFWAALCALSYFYMVFFCIFTVSAWGGYVFIINLIPLHALVLILMGRYSSRIYVAYAFLKYLQSMMSKKEFQYFFFASILLVTVVGFVGIVALTYAGYIAPWSGRFYSLWDTGYAKIHIPIIASVSEHQPTTWVSFFFDLHILAAVFPAGVWYCIKNINDERVFGITKKFKQILHFYKNFVFFFIYTKNWRSWKIKKQKIEHI
uniref:dolichyl-diphosphooligosaccharide--protein glycotransferase n=1 Tax=Romanomermis culicivorax TaxID=13658 RepID=A0A915HSC2_ROMCU